MTNQEKYVNQLHQQFIDYGFELGIQAKRIRGYRLDIESKENVYVVLTVDYTSPNTIIEGNVYDHAKTLLAFLYTDPEFDWIRENIERVLKLEN